MARPNGMKVRGDASKATSGRESTEVNPDMLLVEVPPASEHLDENGVFWWEYYCGLFIESRKLSRYFIPHIHIYCMTLQAIEAFEKKLKEDGHFIIVVKTFKGEEYSDEIENPILKTLSKLYDQADRLGNSIGTTPYSSQVQGIDTGTSLNEAPSQPPALPDDFTPETLPFTGTDA